MIVEMPDNGRNLFVRSGHLLASDMQGASSVRTDNDYVTVCALEGHYAAGIAPLGSPWTDGPADVPPVVVNISGKKAQIVISAGAVSGGVVGLEVMLEGSGVTELYPYAIQATDDSAGIARALGAQIPGASVEGDIITIPSSIILRGRVGGIAKASRRLRRQVQRFRVSLWTNDVTIRDSVGSFLDLGLSDTVWLELADGDTVRIISAGASDGDAMQMQSVYRRDILFDIEFDTVDAANDQQMISYGIRSGLTESPSSSIILSGVSLA
ncbi:hypothetical protein KGY14_11520 [Ameyamaea chiangmaiensis]|uniref:Uncharacterized protein n=1 Tax=Ameyamaea chiangmaiensis TaxID=442969 RepID=A0A850P9T3_9PROT|nr:hypothetical protein [Ameyamaea chiangmaiensis]MBS4075819.1 hypothetical protein [Ameyamaea chiangmaiensis]NVN39310.1 hypothetical protein [Ameyamaea chiangmaiensis]